MSDGCCQAEASLNRGTQLLLLSQALNKGAAIQPAHGLSNHNGPGCLASPFLYNGVTREVF